MRVVTAAAIAAFICIAQARAAESPQIEISAASLPRLDGVDGWSRSSRVAISLLPERHSGVGLAFGLSSLSPVAAPFGQSTPALPSLDLGIQWRYTLDSSYRFDVTAYKRVQNSDAISLIESHDPSYGARFEMGMSSMGRARSKGFVADRGFVGFQLEGGGRLTVKRSGGKPMLYYRNDF